tara:strand:- start:145 stop:762 length:618 start_codon:yes stop_codon:yes gene_type:complete
MEKFKMTQSKKTTWTLVLNETQVKALDSIRSNMVKGKGSIDNAVIETAKHLGDSPTLDLWLATFDRLQKDFETINKIAEKTAQNWLTEVKKGLADDYELTKPQSEDARKLAEKRAEQESAFAHLSTDELKGAVVELAMNGTSKEVTALTKILKARKKSEEKEGNENAKELVKSSIKEITDWIKQDNSLEVQVSRAEKIMAFITKS